ncbi:MAG TPA: hypothetical protein VID67_08805 [Rhizomicrobium sp.]|jgi:hypothetical protein
MRILIAALLGAIAMFIWTAVAHMATPLASMGFSQMPGESAVLGTMDKSIGDHPGLFIFPYVAPGDPKMMEKYSALEKVHPSGMLLYRPAGKGMEGMPPSMLLKEFIKQFVETLIAAWIASMIVGGFGLRWSVVVGIYVCTAIATNVSYWNWYGFPTDYTVAQMIIELVSGIVAGAVIAWWLGRRAA